jgi:hypothetical protein
MASQKKTVDVNTIVSDKMKQDKAWREFSAWINGKDARGGKAAQDALAKERSIRIMKQYGPKLNVPGTIGTAKPPAKKVATVRQSDRVTPKRAAEPARGGQTRRGPAGGQTRRVADTSAYRNRPTRTGRNPNKI